MTTKCLHSIQYTIMKKIMNNNELYDIRTLHTICEKQHANM